MVMAADEAAPVQLETVVVNASADASAQGLSKAYAGGQVARGGRAGILGTKDNLDTPFSITSYTNELIQDQQAQSVGEVLQNDAGVRIARGFGNFQESFFIRGFLLSSDDIAYNGLYSLLPRQYIATELFERVEVLRGASAFLSGASPGGDGVGGAVNLLPKRAPNAPLSRFTAGFDGEQFTDAIDVARRFGSDKEFGVRVNAAYRDGETAVDNEQTKLGLVSVGFDWRGQSARVSADLGYQDNQLDQTRPNVSLGASTFVPKAPDASTNFAQSWTYSNERDLFGTLRGEYDISKSITVWLAYGLRRSEEANSLANPTISDASTGDASTYRFDNTRKDQVNTGELGLRWKLVTGPVSQELVFSASAFELKIRSAYAFDFMTTQATNIYDPVDSPKPAFGLGALYGGVLDAPSLTGKVRLTSYAIGDTVGLFSDRLLVTLGARHQEIKVGVNSDYSKSRTSPSVAAVFKVNKMLSVYGNYIEGLSQGETAPSTFDFGMGNGPEPVNNALAQLSPYVTKQKEVGAKFDAGRIGGSVAVFSTDKPRAFVNTNLDFVASGKDQHRGAELNTYGVVVNGLRVLGGVTWLDAVQKETGNAAVDDNRVIGVPRLLGNVGATWDMPWTDVSLDARVVYTGSSYADDANTLKVPGWTRVDLGARYGIELGENTLTLRARVDNVADRNYWGSVGGYPGAGYLVVGAPRTFALSASLDF
ncbi:MAG: TonB-dependent receptor [Pseudomonadota bacterium]